MFTHDTREALLAVAHLVNTLPEASGSGEDELRTEAELAAFAAEHGYSGTFRRDAAEVAEVRRVRRLLRSLWDLPEEDLVAALNGMLRDHDAVPQLVRHDGHPWHVHAIGSDRPFSDRIVVETAMAVLDLVRTEEHERLRTCAAQDCDAVLVDLSRNRSKRYCDVGNCGNRAHVAAYRARRAAAGG